jgi:hypothetical protein
MATNFVPAGHCFLAFASDITPFDARHANIAELPVEVAATATPAPAAADIAMPLTTANTRFLAMERGPFRKTVI